MKVGAMTTNSRTSALAAFAVAMVIASSTALAAPGDMTITSPALGDKIEIATSSSFAGAISSLRFRGKEYIDTRDHGREMQSAASFDQLGECFNPTEAGSFADGSGKHSSSRLISAGSGANWLATKTDMAFWLAPGTDYQRLAGRMCGSSRETGRAVNNSITGQYLLRKKVTIGFSNVKNILDYEVTYTVPESHRSAVFEAVTVYTPKHYSKRLLYDPAIGMIAHTAIQGEQSLPVILSTPDDGFAIGIYSPSLPQNGLGYGSFAFNNTNKLNCVFREVNVRPADYSYRCFFAVGTVREVTDAIAALRRIHFDAVGQNK
ncbi:MAG: hypothetical protein ACYC7L_03100 [Nitrospirota bacterium]